MSRIVLLPGDGVGPEVTREAVRVLERVAAHLPEVRLTFEERPIGGQAIDLTGEPLPPDTLEACRAADAVLLGAVGGPRWDRGAVRPEAGLLALRQGMGVFANLRPVEVAPALVGASPLKAPLAQRIRYLIVRELTGGLYFGPRGRDRGVVYDTLVYRREEIARVARVAFTEAAARGVPLTLVDKANVLESSRMWREVVAQVAERFPQVPWNTELVDSCAMHLVQDPGRYGVILTENLFGDILSDLGAGTLGSLGLLPSASLGDGGPGLFEPVHGSAPDIAGQGKANPLGAIGAAAMLLRHSLGQAEAALQVEAAVQDALAAGARTQDLAAEGERVLSTSEMTDAVLEALDRRLAASPAHTATKGGRHGGDARERRLGAS